MAPTTTTTNDPADARSGSATVASSADASGASGVLARNLAALGERNTDIIRAIEAAASPTAEELAWSKAADGTAVANYGGRALGSRHAPREEATTFADTIDLRDRAVAVVLGFGLGYHIAELCERVGRTGLVVVLEPDLRLLRGVLSTIDLSAALAKANILIFAGDEPAGRYAERFAGAEGVIVQGVQIVEHPASRARVAPLARDFSAAIAEIVRAARVTAATGLARSSQTVRSILRNARHYVGGEGLAPLAGIAKGRLGIVVSAGPSLRRNLRLLAEEGVRERCVIVATQTVLKPLLAEGIRPHFVAALDWHQISRRFYDGLRAADCAETTLVLDPQANPVIAASYPGPIRTIAAPHLDALLGPLARDMGRLPPGATVAHLCYQIARFLGCDPVALIGQDLGFTDGVYYARGTAIDDVWAPELNPFNTIENLEWTRIVRHRSHLVKRRDVHGRSIYTDAQMETYLQRFEAFFLQDERRGLRTVDATEGGVRKAGTVVARLADTLAEHAREPVPEIPLPARAPDERRLRSAVRRLDDVADEIRTIRIAARRTADALAQFTGDAPRTEPEDRLWRTIDGERAKVGERLDALRLLDDFSQLGVMKRAKADRRIEQSRGIDDAERQRLRFERDLVNVRWIEEVAEEYLGVLDETQAILEGRLVPHEIDEAGIAARSEGALGRALGDSAGQAQVVAEVRAWFVVPVDPWHGGLGTPRSLSETIAGRPAIQWTLERLGASREARGIALLVPEGFDIEPLIDRGRIGLPVEIHRTQGSPLAAARTAVAPARLWSDSSWRGGIAGMTCYDEVLAPAATLEAMERFGASAAVLVGPDWPLVTVLGEDGCDALVRRHRTRPDVLRLVFNQAPPGLSGILLERSLLTELARGGRHASIGWLLAYEPTRPQQDPISKDVCVQIDPTVRRSLVRAVFDTPRNMIRMRRAIEPGVGASGGVASLDARAAVALLEHQLFDTVPYYTPQHVIVEINTGRQGSGAASPHRMGSLQRAVMTERRFARLVEQLGESRDTVLTLGGAGDPLMHPDVAQFIRMAKDAGVRGVHLRTELVADPATIESVVAAGVDAVSVELDASSGECYRRMHGVDRYASVLANLDRIFTARRVVTGAGTGALAVPWIVPRLQRRVESYEDIEAFFDTWQRALGTPVLEGPPPFDDAPETPADTLASARAPSRAMWREMLRRLVVLSDGTVPLSELDLRGDRLFASVERTPLLQLWRDLVARRKQIRRDQGELHPDLRTRWP